MFILYHVYIMFIWYNPVWVKAFVTYIAVKCTGKGQKPVIKGHPKGETENGLYRQVVFILSSLLLVISSEKSSCMAIIYMVVFIQRWSLKQVWLY